MEARGCNRGNQWQMARPRRPLEQAKTVAVGCDRLPESFHGKEGVDDSSPSEGSAKAPQVGAFSFSSTCSKSNARVAMEPFMKPSREDGDPDQPRSRSTSAPCNGDERLPS